MIKILKAIATHAQPSKNTLYDSEFPQGQLKDLVKVSQKTVVDTLVKLENFGYIKLSRKEHSNKGGKDKKFYTLTFSGFIHALLSTPAEQREKILRKFPSMLLIARKLPLFAFNVKTIALGLLDTALSQELLNTFRYRNIGVKLTYPSDQAWRHELDSSVIMGLLIGGPVFFKDDYRDFLKLCRNDKGLYSFVQSVLEQEIKEYDATKNFKEVWEKVSV
jgi:hypothetical protein